MKINESAFSGEKIKFPVKINLKVICNNTFPDLVNQTHIVMAIEESGLQNQKITVNESKKQNYFSYTIIINIETELMMQKLYENIRGIPGFVMAI